MDGIEMELCPNCKKEIPSSNYVMHTVHCARNITLCSTCKEPFPRSDVESHKIKCEEAKKRRDEAAKKPAMSAFSSSKAYQSKYLQNKSTLEQSQSKVTSSQAVKQSSVLQKVSSSVQKEESSSVSQKLGGGRSVKEEVYRSENLQQKQQNGSSSKSSMLACKYCELELPKLDLDDHENYCGSRTDKCMECGELVMFKYKQLHEDSNHGFLKLNDEPGPKASWDSNTERTATTTSDSDRYSRRNLSPMHRPFAAPFDISQYVTYSPQSMGYGRTKKEDKKESYKEISRRLDCKTEYIRNLLHDSASITIPLRSSSTAPRNHFNHNKGPAPQPPARKRNPPTALEIPCEFCGLQIPHEDLIEHETGCRPDLARFNPRRRLSPGEDDYSMPAYVPPSASGSYLPSASEVPYSPSNTNPDDEELPCEFCSEMLPASQLWRHQMTCN